MVIERTELVRLLEEALFLMPTERGDIAELRIPGVRGRITPISHPMVNLVGSVPRAGGLSSAATIQEVVERFRSENKAFGWITGSLSPEGLERQLLANRLVKIEEFAGMVLSDLAKPIVTRPGVRVVEVPAEERDKFQALLSMGHFNFPPTSQRSCPMSCTSIPLISRCGTTSPSSWASTNIAPMVSRWEALGFSCRAPTVRISSICVGWTRGKRRS